MEITDEAAIERMVLPAGWAETTPGVVAGADRLREFQAPSSGARICIFCRGLPLPESDATRFKELLAQPPHELSPEEFQGLGEVLRGHDNPARFELASAITRNLNGRMALLVEGQYRTVPEGILIVFAPADQACRSIEEWQFRARGDGYRQHYGQAVEALRSIVWRSPVV